NGPEKKPQAPPTRTSTSVAVLIQYPGMPAHSIERLITNRLERRLSQADGVGLIESRTVSGSSLVKVHFQDHVVPGIALAEVTNLAMSAPSLLPGQMPPRVFLFDPANVLPAAVLVIQDEQLPPIQIADLARLRIVEALALLPGVSARQVLGGGKRIVRINL